MIAGFLENCLCGCFSYSLVLCVCFALFLFLFNPNSATHILTKRQSQFQMHDGNASTQLNFIPLDKVSPHECSLFPLCGRKRKATEKSIWKIILAYVLPFSLWVILWLLALRHQVSSSGLHFLPPLIDKLMELMTQFGLTLPAWTSVLSPECTASVCPGLSQVVTVGDKQILFDSLNGNPVTSSTFPVATLSSFAVRLIKREVYYS